MAQPTGFAPAERADDATVHEQAAEVAADAELKALYEAVSDIVLVLNPERQIVYCNQNLLDALGITDMQQILGKRPGEALDCIHSHEGPHGCGTTEFCQHCGAARAILASQRGKQVIRECRIIRRQTEALDLRVRATPLALGTGETRYTVFAMTDISHEKRRQVLERIFFHDIMNTAAGVRNLSELLNMVTENEQQPLKDMIYKSANALVEEIRNQRELIAAENHELNILPSATESLDVLHTVLSVYQQHEVAAHKVLHLDPDAASVILQTDKALLCRVLGNMTKNALEACQPGDIVTLGCKRQGHAVCFWVHNPAVMPRDVQQQLFQRSFSTKGKGRGLGTYSMKLLSERYLHGQVDFSSGEGQGTTFTATYPLSLPPADETPLPPRC